MTERGRGRGKSTIEVVAGTVKTAKKCPACGPDVEPRIRDCPHSLPRPAPRPALHAGFGRPVRSNQLHPPTRAGYHPHNHPRRRRRSALLPGPRPSRAVDWSGMSGVSLPVTRPSGRALLVANDSSRAEPLEALRLLGFE